MSDLHFDPHQFAGYHNKFPVQVDSVAGELVTTGLAFEDYTRAHTQTHKGSKPHVPPFALNTNQLKAVLIERAKKYLCRRSDLRRLATDTTDWKTLNRLCTEAAMSYDISDDNTQAQKDMVNEHKATIERVGGYLEMQAAIAFRSWRLGEDSTHVGDELGMLPCTVRVVLERLRNTARSLGFDAGADRRSEKRKQEEAHRAQRRIDRTQAKAEKASKAAREKSEKAAKLPSQCAQCGKPFPVAMACAPRKFCCKKCRVNFHNRYYQKRKTENRAHSPGC